jgi:hypothetical protein
MPAWRLFSMMEISHAEVDGKNIGTLLTYLLTHGAEPFLRSCQLWSYSRTSQHFMEPEVSLPCSQKPSTGPILSQIDPIHTIPSYLPKIHFNILRLGLPSGLFPSGSLTNILYAFLFSPHSCYMSCYLILRDFIILIMLGEEYKLWSSSLCSFLHPPVTSPRLICMELNNNDMIEKFM